MPKPWLLSQGGVHSQINGFVLKQVMAQGTPPLKRKGLQQMLAS
jgi:hypothetical protein